LAERSSDDYGGISERAIAANGAGQSEKSTGVLSSTPEAEKTERGKNLAAATEAAKQLLLAMDTNKSG
jgi:hypothetical protein